MNLDIRVWDVGHGLSVWIKTPNGQNHWIDAGYNPNPDFSPSSHVAGKYPNTSPIHLLIISHPDKDHFDDLHNLINILGKPQVLVRNKSLPDEEKFGRCDMDYQLAFKKLDNTYNNSIDWTLSPLNPAVNGGVTIKTGQVNWAAVMDKNNTSVVVMYQYMDTLIIFPGDIEEKGRKLLEAQDGNNFAPLVRKSTYKILVAPHHGRGSGYCQQMMDFIDPNLVVISDQYGREPTDRRFRERPNGVRYNGIETKFISTKTNGRARFVVGAKGLSHFDWK